MGYNYSLIHCTLDAGVLVATIDNPPINVFTPELWREMVAFTGQVEGDDDVRVLVVESADPDFWIAHFDVPTLIAMEPSDPVAADQARNASFEDLNDFHKMCERVRTMPRATIAKIAGRVGGGGSEFAASFDMRFGARTKTRINQMEVPLGILPGGSGTQRLPRLLGRGRALEVILGAEDLDAETAERWGYLNRALPDDELDEFVERLARRIASFPAMAIANAKRSTLNALETHHIAGLHEEARLFQELLATDEARDRMRRFMERGGQTRPGELRVAEIELSEEGS